MGLNGIVGKAPRRYKTTTIADPEALPTAVDLVKRIFGPGTVELDALYCGDITDVRTWEGWLYLATVIDVASRRVVGWAMATIYGRAWSATPCRWRSSSAVRRRA
jgi:transposase InsO family protein